MTVWEAAQRYAEENVPLVVLAGGQYGTGSSRDWAAKGTLLLGVRVVVAKSYERIHRSNLIGMGVLPLLFPAGQDAASLGLTGRETFALPTLSAALGPRAEVPVVATGAQGEVSFLALAALETEYEADIWRQGGILPAVQRKLMAG